MPARRAPQHLVGHGPYVPSRVAGPYPAWWDVLGHHGGERDHRVASDGHAAYRSPPPTQTLSSITTGLTTGCTLASVCRRLDRA